MTLMPGPEIFREIKTVDGKTLDPRIIEQFNQRAPFRLEESTLLVLALMGSHSHGTYIPPEDPNAVDDVDYMGVVIPPESYTSGIKTWKNDNVRFQFEELDCIFYSFQRFVQLLMKQNPNVVGLLWLRDEHYIVHHDLWNIILTERRAFSSKAAYASFTGYAKGQLEKMEIFTEAIQSEWDHANEVIRRCGWTTEAVVTKQGSRMPPKGSSYSKEEVEAAITSAIRIHARHFKGYMGEKRKSLARKYGYDVKNAAHLLRLMTMCNEFLATGRFNVFRETDAKYFMDIKRGKYSLDFVKDEALRLFEMSERLFRSSLLPSTPDVDFIDLIVRNIHRVAYRWGDAQFS